MEVAQRTAMIDAMEKAFAEDGIDLYEGARRLKLWLDRRVVHITAAQSRESLDAYLACVSVNDEAFVQEMLALYLAGPKIVREFLPKAVTEAADSLPTQVGRPARLTIDLERKIIDKILGLVRQKVSIGVAQSRCAREFVVSKRTVQSAWARRDELAQQPFKTIEDLLSFFRK